MIERLYIYIASVDVVIKLLKKKMHTCIVIMLICLFS